MPQHRRGEIKLPSDRRVPITMMPDAAGQKRHVGFSIMQELRRTKPRDTSIYVMSKGRRGSSAEVETFSPVVVGIKAS